MKMKKMLSMLLAAAMVLSIAPTAMITSADAPTPLPIQIMARTGWEADAGGDGSTGSERLIKSDTVNITGNGQKSITLTNTIGGRTFTGIMLRSEGASPSVADWDKAGTSVAVDTAFADAKITINSVTVTGATATVGLQGVTDLDLVPSYTDNPFENRANVALWNTFYPVENRIAAPGGGLTTAFTSGGTEANGWVNNADPGVVFPAGVSAITITFTVSGVQGSDNPIPNPNACPTCGEEDCNGCLDVVLQARVLWLNGDGWNYTMDLDGPVQNIKKDDTNKNYTLTFEVEIPPGQAADQLDAITDFKIAQKGTVVGDRNVNPGQTNKALRGPFREAAVTIKKIKVGDTEVATLDHYMRPWFVARDDDAVCLGVNCLSGTPNGCTDFAFWCPSDPHAGFASASIWNAWWKPHQLVAVGGDNKLDTKLFSNANNANTLTSDELSLLSFTVEFSLCIDGDRCEKCNGCNTANCANCGGCTCEDFCDLCGCSQCFPALQDADNGKCGRTNCPNCNEDYVKKAILAPREADEPETPNIFDALEILKYLVGMEGAIITKAGQTPEINPNMKAAAIIAPRKEGEATDIPNIFDALEILKYLVGMECELTDEYPKS